MMNAICRISPLFLIIVFTACSSSDEQLQPAPTQASVRQVSAEDLELVKGQVVYVPTYSNIFFADTEQTWDLAVTVAIRNTDADNPIIIQSARFYDTDGKLVTDYVAEPLELAPFGTANIVLERTDARGGVGANFIVEWAAEIEVLEPVIESVMVSTAGTQGLGFISPGKVISGDDLPLVTGQSVYVPAYSDIFFANTESTWDLAVTLAVHNTDSDNPITVTSARYYDTDGNLVTEYVEEPVELSPWATIGVVIERTDESGGVGANFIVDWEADTDVTEPVIETVMVSTSGTQGLGFNSPGRVISQTP
jgi:hypothetical protein